MMRLRRGFGNCCSVPARLGRDGRCPVLVGPVAPQYDQQGRQLTNRYTPIASFDSKEKCAGNISDAVCL
jgi:hypothetical protein